METKDWITLAIALYGAILSTFVIYREKKKEERSFSAGIYARLTSDGTITPYLFLVNNNHRPITILGVKVFLCKRFLYFFSRTISEVHPKDIFEAYDPILPKTLKDGEFFEGPLSAEIFSYIKMKNNKIKTISTAKVRGI